MKEYIIDVSDLKKKKVCCTSEQLPIYLNSNDNKIGYCEIWKADDDYVCKLLLSELPQASFDYDIEENYDNVFWIKGIILIEQSDIGKATLLKRII